MVVIICDHQKTCAFLLFSLLLLLFFSFLNDILIKLLLKDLLDCSNKDSKSPFLWLEKLQNNLLFHSLIWAAVQMLSSLTHMDLNFC